MSESSLAIFAVYVYSFLSVLRSLIDSIFDLSLSFAYFLSSLFLRLLFLHFFFPFVLMSLGYTFMFSHPFPPALVYFSFLFSKATPFYPTVCYNCEELSASLLFSADSTQKSNFLFYNGGNETVVLFLTIVDYKNWLTRCAWIACRCELQVAHCENNVWADSCFGEAFLV